MSSRTSPACHKQRCDGERFRSNPISSKNVRWGEVLIYEIQVEKRRKTSFTGKRRGKGKYEAYKWSGYKTAYKTPGFPKFFGTRKTRVHAALRADHGWLATYLLKIIYRPECWCDASGRDCHLTQSNRAHFTPEGVCPRPAPAARRMFFALG